MSSLLLRAGLVVVTVGLARLGAWMLVAAVTSSVVVLALDRWREARDRLPRRLGALAVICADDERAHSVPLLAFHAMTGPTGSLERAQDLLRRETSLSRWAEGSERIASAEAAAEATSWLRPRREPRTWWSLGTCAFVAVGAAVWVALSESMWSVALFVMSFTGAVVALTDLRLDRHWTPQLLATLACSGRSGRRPLSELTAQARTCTPATVGRAQRLVRSWDLETRTRRDAEILLELERGGAASARSRSRLRSAIEHGTCALAGAATWAVPL